MASKSRTESLAKVQSKGARNPGSMLAQALDRALAQGLSQEEIMALIEDRVDTLTEQGDAARIYTELPDGLIDLPTAVAKYGLHRQTLRNWVLRGQLPVYGRLRASAPGGGFLIVSEAELKDHLHAPKDRGGRPRKVPQ